MSLHIASHRIRMGHIIPENFKEKLNPKIKQLLEKTGKQPWRILVPTRFVIKILPASIHDEDCTDTWTNTTHSRNGSCPETPKNRPTLWNAIDTENKQSNRRSAANNIRLLARLTKLVTHRALCFGIETDIKQSLYCPQRRSLIHSQNVNSITRPATCTLNSCRYRTCTTNTQALNSKT